MRRSGALTLLWVVTSGCYLSRPAFVEPQWGDAPAPAADQIAEITRDHVQCTLNSCRHTKLILSRDGRASQVYSTREGVDSFFVGQIDSVAFRALAQGFVRLGFFGLSEDDTFNPVASDATMTSASILCRRKVRVVDESIPTKPDAYPWREDDRRVQVLVDSIVGVVHWGRCCRPYR
jgi:hypothetical protein